VSLNNSLQLRYKLRKGDFYSEIDLTLPAQGITAIFGPSGSGKSTLLRCVAGLEPLDAGLIQFKKMQFQNGKITLPTHKRPIGYVFQTSNLFPHLTVQQNLMYGYKRIPISERKIILEEATHLLGIESLTQRYPHQLSGGQQQRVGIARALLTSPQLLLMDEPLASLDQASKNEILPYLEALHQQLDIPILYVSHALNEVVRIADTMVILDHGRVTHQGPLNSLLTDPNLPLSHLEEACVVADGIVIEHQPEFHLTECATEFGTLFVSQRELERGHKVRVKIMARDVSIALDRAERSSISNILPLCVVAIVDSPDPAQVLVKLKTPDDKGAIMLSRITRRSLAHLQLSVGQTVFAQIKAVSLMRDQTPQLVSA